MNPMTQPDIHPDADALNAFAERTLPDAERARMVAHMAGCARCREVVYLAQIAAEAEAAPVAATRPELRPGWFGVVLAKWRIGLIPAAALAATGAVVLWVQLRPAPPPSEMAKMTRPQTAQAPAAAHRADRAVAPGSLPIPGPPAARRPVRPEPKKAMPASRAIAVPRISSVDQVARNEAGPASSAPVGSRLAGGYHLDGHSASMARQAPIEEPPGVPGAIAFEPALTSPEWQQPQTATITPAAKSRAKAMKPFPAPPPPNVAALHDTVVASGNGGPHLLNAEALPELQLAPQPLNGMAVLRIAGRTKLPSGLNSVSSAAMLNRLLAVDSAGAVFLSQDAGRHWEAVPAQWNGKAVALHAPPQGFYRLTASAGLETLGAASLAAPATEEKPSNPSPSASTPAPPPPASSSAPLAAKAGAAPPIPAMLFTLVTDRHQTWVSADGKVWREQ